MMKTSKHKNPYKLEEIQKNFLDQKKSINE